MTLTRRRFLKQTFGFSAAALLSRGAGPLLAAKAEAPDSQACHMLAVGDYGVKDRDLERQKAVAGAMARYASAANLKPAALAMLGDNFYGGLAGKGVKSPRWDINVEQMYPAGTFPCPMYAMLGNHDYNDEADDRSVAAQLAYRQHAPDSRWTLPAKWYRFDLLAQDPLASFIVLDTNWADGSVHYPDDHKQQMDWLAGELARPRPTPWLFVLGHHPVFNDGKHGDTKGLVEQLDPLLRKNKVDLYLCGHDHDLQHLEFDGHPTSFVVSGAGGAKSYELAARPRRRFGQSVYGFSHLEIQKDRFIVRHIDANATVLYAFTKTHDGHVTAG